MSIADKLAVVAANEQEVYKAGKRDGREFFQKVISSSSEPFEIKPEDFGDITQPRWYALCGSYARKIDMSTTKIERLWHYFAQYSEKLEKIILPNGLKWTADKIVANCPKITELTYPSSIVEIGWLQINGCSNIATIKIKGKPSAINSAAFSNTNQMDIYCAWAEGEVAGAPWGATNATIHYNYTGE